MFRSIYSKIAGLLLLFNVALLGFFFLFDDYVPKEVERIKNELSLKANFFAKIVKPILMTEDISHFEKAVRIENLINDRNLFTHDQLRIYRSDEKEKLSDYFKYFDGEERRQLEKVEVAELPIASNKTKPDPDNLASRLFRFYKPLLDERILSEEIVEIRSRFFPQAEVLDSDGDTYRIRVVAPIREKSKTLGIVEVWKNISIKEVYIGRNNARLIFLVGMSSLTLIFGVMLALSIALPIRRLSKRLDRNLTPDDVATQLKSFTDRKLSARKDEVGLLYKNLIKLTSQVSLLFEEKERFASEVSHELKNPIASIIAQTENYAAKDEDDALAISKIKEQAVRMNKLISEISEAAVVDNDLVTKAREKFDLSTTVNEILEHYVDSNEHPELQLSSEIQKNIVLLGLPDRIGQVLVNLLDNAISFSKPKGNIKVELHKRWRRKPILIVEDSGPGVSEGSREIIFERFYTSRSGGAVIKNSSGLGLFICKQIVEAHGGRISVGGSSLGGARFEVNF